MRNLKRVGMVAAALLGAAWLAWLGLSLVRVKPGGQPDVLLRREAVALYASKSLIARSKPRGSTIGCCGGSRGSGHLGSLSSVGFSKAPIRRQRETT